MNVDKTKVLVFSKGAMLKRKFYYNTPNIENVKEFKYLGIVLSRTGSYCKAKKHLCEQAQKAMYGVIRKIRQFNLPIECQLDLFDKVVTPILLYGCEIWGYENMDIIERVHLKFLKTIFNLKSSTPNYMIYGETGRFPLYINVFTRMTTYWSKMFTCTEDKIVNIVYKYMYNQLSNDGIKCQWIECIQKILNNCGLSFIWNGQGVVNAKWLSAIVNQNLKDQFIQKWSNDINSSSKGQIYRIFKTNFGFESYIKNLHPKQRKLLMKMRTSNHHLPVETGRWCGTPLNERVCLLCNNGKIGDEYHYILECTAFSEIRKNFYTKVTAPDQMLSSFMNSWPIQIYNLYKNYVLYIYFKNI